MIRPFAVVFLLSACRPDPGDPEYPVYEPWVGTGSGGFLQGPVPYVEGVDRLSFGIFYEGQASETQQFEDYFIYESTYTQTVSDDRVEGLTSDMLVVTGAQLWWGGGLEWRSAKDLSGWTTMRVSFLADDELFEDMAIEMFGGSAGRARPADYGFVADGEWHTLAIPLTDFENVSLAAVTSPARFVADVGTPDAELLIDDLYLTKE